MENHGNPISNDLHMDEMSICLVEHRLRASWSLMALAMTFDRKGFTTSAGLSSGMVALCCFIFSSSNYCIFCCCMTFLGPRFWKTNWLTQEPSQVFDLFCTGLSPPPRSVQLVPPSLGTWRFWAGLSTQRASHGPPHSHLAHRIGRQSRSKVCLLEHNWEVWSIDHSNSAAGCRVQAYPPVV